jgi:hypothetical protein
MVCLESKTKEVIAIKMGAKRARFSRLQSEVDVLLVKDGSEADRDSQDFRAKSMSLS